ncbi:hypothetical protein AUG19_08940 [archaeon 13_1_20CM_2_54_9]|nr:MAG: hypothetical protein AUJ07_01935 [Crenarchaeota archaeon 13_1_40CM_3_53_5]OLE74352.1 MAG: hypothetical protein AUG19_08940 [archaeon 13_1_20CM_2_54_9]
MYYVASYDSPRRVFHHDRMTPAKRRVVESPSPDDSSSSSGAVAGDMVGQRVSHPGKILASKVPQINTKLNEDRGGCPICSEQQSSCQHAFLWRQLPGWIRILRGIQRRVAQQTEPPGTTSSVSTNDTF